MTQMYNISNYDPGAYLTGLKNIALQKYNQQMGASGAGADIAVKTASLPTRIKTGIQSVLPSKNLFQLSNLGQLAKVPEIDQLGLEYGLTEQPEKVNLARHAAASRELANTLSPNIPGGRYIGNTLSFLGGLAEEGSDLASRGLSALPAIREDISANIEGLKYPTGTTAREIYEDIYNEPQEGLASLPEVQPIQANTNINPLDYDNLFDFYGDYLRPYIAEEQPGYRTFIGDVSPGYIGPEGEGYNPTLYEQYIADRARGKEIFNTRFD